MRPLNFPPRYNVMTAKLMETTVRCPECGREASEHGRERAFALCLKSEVQVLREHIATLTAEDR